MTTKISLDGNEISSDTLKELYDRNGDVKSTRKIRFHHMIITVSTENGFKMIPI